MEHRMKNCLGPNDIPVRTGKRGGYSQHDRHRWLLALIKEAHKPAYHVTTTTIPLDGFCLPSNCFAILVLRGNGFVGFFLPKLLVPAAVSGIAFIVFADVKPLGTAIVLQQICCPKKGFLG